MIETASKQETKGLSTKIAALNQLFNKNGDTETAQKAKQLALKLNEQEFSIAFCGHFSAGKSSMINKIVGENLLPSSPIPTSANLVKIKSGEEYAKVYFKEGKPRLYPAPYNYKKVKSYAKDGDQIHSIEISHATDKLPKAACIMDTPGIDSTDDAHRIATESALHLADLVFYVMDYNHVQSELNFLFTKELTSAGKDVYLIINQIDKHRDEELSFEQFKTSVKDSFAAWGVHPAEIFYTSLKFTDHPENDFPALQNFIQSKLSERHELLPQSVYHSLVKLVEEHRLFLEENDHAKIDQLNEVLDGLSLEEQEMLSGKLADAENKLAELSSMIQEKDNELLNGVDDILKNAYLMPASTRELAEAYLEARQPDFKVGLFFTKQKTAQERQERLGQFFEDFQDKVKAQLEWHLRDFFLGILKNAEIHDSELINKIQKITVPVAKDLLENTVKTGARLSGDYVLNYTNDVAEGAKRLAKEQIKDIRIEYLNIIKNHNEELVLEAESRRNELLQLFEAWSQKQRILANQKDFLLQMEDYLSGRFDEGKYAQQVEEIIKNDEEVEIYNQSEEDHAVEVSEKQIEVIDAVKESAVEEVMAHKELDEEKFKATVKKLKYTAQELRDVPGFKKITAELIEKAERLESRGFTVALFGAFSAGKSSFANALIGEKLLPVSPNPTTAAINKIMPVDGRNVHGLVKVQLKAEKVLFEDVKRSLSVFDFEARDFDEALKQIDKVMKNHTDFDAHEKTHFAFLNAFSKGFNAYRDQLGEIIETDIKEFRDFVANEEKSCLVETIEVYYDCELTRKGITLVDTPGADSINARHTGVAFEYIKNSDAILFVTYYNHAFSKADREFLIQLGRVKDTFELDKMFFMVNAVDLANNDEEKQDVLDYVSDQLIQYGIRKPNLFPISSLLAIKEKLTNDKGLPESGIQAFEEKFYSFITHDLTDIAINSALIEWERAAGLLRSYIHSAREGNEQKQLKISRLQEEQNRIQQLLENQSAEVLLERLSQEVEELTYYIKQRVFYRFSDFFKEAFNPSALKDDGRNLKKAIQHALEEFLTDFGFDFAQELRATTLRIEGFLAKILGETHGTLTKEVLKINDEHSFSQFQLGEIEGISFDSAFSDLDRDLFKKVLTYFKNPKTFFENNERKLMQEALEQVMQKPTDDYLEREGDRLKVYYKDQLIKEMDELIHSLLEEIAEYYDGMYATLRNEIPIQQLEEIERKIQSQN